MKFIGIIPARYASTRFPAKPLAILGGKTVIERVYRQVEGVLDEVCVATDDERIMDTVQAFGGKAVMTSVNHKSGTDRVQEAFTKVGTGYDVIVNIQGDEPFIQAQQLEAIRQCFDDESVDIATLVKPFKPEDGFEALENVNSPKVVVNKKMEALYFSRSIIPFTRGKEKAEWLKGHTRHQRNRDHRHRHTGRFGKSGEVPAIVRIGENALLFPRMGIKSVSRYPLEKELKTQKRGILSPYLRFFILRTVKMPFFFC